MTAITCKTCGKVEDRCGYARYCLACGRERIRTRQKAKSKNGALRTQVVELVATLRFYADPATYKSTSTGFTAQYDPEPAPIWKDTGDMAREAIKAVCPDLIK